jgi:hypothetical protein
MSRFHTTTGGRPETGARDVSAGFTAVPVLGTWSSASTAFVIRFSALADGGAALFGGAGLGSVVLFAAGIACDRAAGTSANDTEAAINKTTQI